MSKETLITLSADTTDERIAALSLDFSKDLRKLGVDASVPHQEDAPGSRGDAVTVGQLALAVLTGGTLTALIECFKVYMSRDQSLTMKITRADGSAVEVNAKNVDGPEVQKALGVVQEQ